MTIEEFKRFVETRKWQFAKTMKSYPHEYTIVFWKPRAKKEFYRAVIFIRAYGEERSFYRKRFVYFDLDGWTYWTMGDLIGKTILINRARVENSHRYEIRAEK